MSAHQFTKGPWRNIAAIRKIVAEMGFGLKSEQEANANLIAAAPNLYEALHELIELAHNTYDIPDKCFAALRKARGEQS